MTGKKIIFYFFLFQCCFGFAQNSSGANTRTDHYLLISEAGTSAVTESIARELEMRFAVFNTLFRFEVSSLLEPLKVRVFTNETAYNSYIISKTGTRQPGALYLHFKNQEDRELVVCRGSREEKNQLPYQAFVQFLRGFIANPPEWMIEGFGIYFSSLEFNTASGELTYDENLMWLEEARKIEENASSILSVMEYVREGGVMASQDFQVRSWALVSFFLISGLEEYYRSLTECFMLLSSDANAQTNSRTVIDHIGSWDDFDLLDSHFQLYLKARKNFAEYIEEGQIAYRNFNLDSAMINFLFALERRSDHYAPYYFLALVYHAEKNYEAAEEFYRRSLELGANEELVFFALGLNSAAAGKNTEAIDHLRKAAELPRFRRRSEELISFLQN